jgi:hypothetical protein
MYGRHDLEGNGRGAGCGDRGCASWLRASLRPALYRAAPGRAARGRWKRGDGRDGPGAVGGRGPPPALGAEGPPCRLDGWVLQGGVPALVRRPGVRLETPRRNAGPRELRRPRRSPHRDGREERVEAYCDVASGSWFDPYGGQTYADPEDIDIVHIVPLANAWRSGASSWSTTNRESFANVPRDLLSVDDGLNQSKGDKGPEAWKPPRKAYWCVYAKRWIGVKHYWDLSVTGAERSALKQMLGRCRG